MSLLARDRNNHTIQGIRPGTVQHVTVSGSSARTTTTVDDATTIVRIVSTTNCHYVVGNGTPSATTNDTYLPAGVVEYVSVGKGDKLAFIQDSAGGTAYVTEGA